MPAWTASDGDNWADEISYKLWIEDAKQWDNISLDQAQGKVVVMTEVHPFPWRTPNTAGEVTIYVKSPEDVGLANPREIKELRDLVKAGKEDRVEIDSLVDEVIQLEKKINDLRRTLGSVRKKI